MTRLFWEIIVVLMSVIVPVALALTVKHRARTEKQGRLGWRTSLVIATWMVAVIAGASYIISLAFALVDNWESLTVVQWLMCGFAALNLVAQVIAATAMYRQINAPYQLPR